MSASVIDKTKLEIRSIRKFFKYVLKIDDRNLAIRLDLATSKVETKAGRLIMYVAKLNCYV